MTANLSGPLTFSDDVMLVPVTELSEESRAQITCDDGDFALSRTRSRSGSKIIDADAASLIARFREPRTMVQAVILFGREKQLDPKEVFEEAFPFIASLVEAGFLVAAEGGEPPEGDAAREVARIEQAPVPPGARRLRTLQVLDDTEVSLLRRDDGRMAVLKLERSAEDPRARAGRRRQLDHESTYLEHLGGRIAPRLLSKGDVADRAYLEIEFVAGADAASAAAEWRERGDHASRGELLRLCRSIAASYEALHAAGVIHGDVHPRNVLVEADGTVRVIDFGVAAPRVLDGSLPAQFGRGGLPFFFEPELALASLGRGPAAPASQAGEQHAVAAMLYFLVTGAYWQDFRLAREEMLEDIATRTPLRFEQRGAPAWPELEGVLLRALAKQPAERFPCMRDFAQALEAVPEPGARSSTEGARDEPDARQRATSSLEPLLAAALERAGWDGVWSRSTLGPAPTTSINYGSAGIALGLLHVALRRGDAELFALAEAWARRAEREIGGADAFHNPDIDITPEIVGRCSPYHSASGVHALQALIAAAAGDRMAQGRAIARFLEDARAPAVGLDLTLGRSSALLGAAILFDALPSPNALDPAPLRAFGDAAQRELWDALDGKAEIASADVEYLGIAHGWAGFLYATLQWCAVSGAPVPSGLERRLAELDALGLPNGRGLEWPWMLRRPGEPMTMAGWCNGTCGYVFLWTLAHRVLGAARYLELAERAAWRTWEASEPVVTLCCGSAGRVYALLNCYRHGGDRAWLARANELAANAARHGNRPPEYPHSLYKGEFGLALLAADLERPLEAAMPFFEPMGYGTRG